MDKHTFHELIDKYMDGTASAEERILLDEYADQLAKMGEMTMSVEEKLRLKEEMHRNILMQLASPETKVIPLYRKSFFRIVAAAVVILMVIGGGYYAFFRNNLKQSIVSKTQNKTDILPGHDGAILTLADGSRIVLDNAQDGKITDVAVKNGNKVSYENTNLTKVEYNTMTTPKGRQFTLVLPDGSQVWLNAASSITYPTAFVGNERKVSITGEAYFEVAHNASKPFHVNVNGMDVQVLGTHFNINSYSDEGSVKTTLLEGSVKVSSNNSSVIIKPNEQAVLKLNSSLAINHSPDVDAVMAWKNGFFSFEAASIKDIMKQLSRWYDVDVIYDAEPKELFAGKIDRNLTLSQVLKVLSDTKVNFRIEDGKKLIILP